MCYILNSLAADWDLLSNDQLIASNCHEVSFASVGCIGEATAMNN